MLEKFVPTNPKRYAVEFLEKLAEGFYPVREKGKSGDGQGVVSFVHVPQVTNVAGSVRSALGKNPTSTIDNMLFENIRETILAPGSFDVVRHVAKRQWNQTADQWKNLEEGVRDGFLSLTYQAITGAIQKGRMF